MPHIHTNPGEIDLIAEVFVVYKNKVLIRLHEKYNIWIAPGGHVELNETPQEAAVREVKEETGLDIELYSGNMSSSAVGKETDEYVHLIPPMFMNVHEVMGSGGHRHLPLVYFATAKTDQIIQPDNHEKTDCRWLTKDEILAMPEIKATIKVYALKALEVLAH